jgi:hypothetical protein
MREIVHFLDYTNNVFALNTTVICLYKDYQIILSDKKLLKVGLEKRGQSKFLFQASDLC